MHLTLQSVYPVVIIVFFLYKKIKRSIGYQPLKPRWLFTRMILFSMFAFGLTIFSLIHPFLYRYFIIGILGGCLLVFFARKNLSFEKRRGKIYFRTHIWVELILLTLFLSRFLYRVTELYLAAPDLHSLGSYSQSIGTDPFTIGVCFLIAVYYIGFSSTVIKISRNGLEQNGHSKEKDILA
ncbi:kinase [Bacillus halotolerans]|uniref:mother cell-specific sporulation protein Csk22 n=1 Tax=Bacillus halotolerans TaxID=260554 RepID=UPI001C0E9A4D|nr:mother cell-specific sporulation protein Csk22 [Bacillus halotolerans]MBU5245434.1 kinase [Bacillus halotolerans]